MSAEILGEWKTSNQTINLSAENGRLFAIVNQNQRVSMKCGINGQASHAIYIEKIKVYAEKKFPEISIFFHQTSELKEVRIIEASKIVAVRIKEAIEQLEALNETTSFEIYQKILSLFDEAFKIQNSKNTSTEELEASINEFKIKMFFKEAKDQAHLFLPEKSQVIEFNQVINRYIDDEDPFSCFSEELKMKEKPLTLPYQYLAALVKEYQKNTVEAAQNYVKLALNHHNPMPCLQKIERLIKAHSDQEEWKNRSDWIRIYFESFLPQLKALSNLEKIPTCFISFNDEETDVEQWLEQDLLIKILNLCFLS